MSPKLQAKAIQARKNWQRALEVAAAKKRFQPRIHARNTGPIKLEHYLPSRLPPLGPGTPLWEELY